TRLCACFAADQGTRPAIIAETLRALSTPLRSRTVAGQATEGRSETRPNQSEAAAVRPGSRGDEVGQLYRSLRGAGHLVRAVEQQPDYFRTAGVIVRSFRVSRRTVYPGARPGR